MNNETNKRKYGRIIVPYGAPKKAPYKFIRMEYDGNYCKPVVVTIPQVKEYKIKNS